MRITLVVPGLLAIPHDALAQDAALARIATLAEPAVERDLDSAILADLAIDAAPAPLAALGAGVDVRDAWTIRADPVTMSVGHDDVRIVGAVHDLDDDERAALLRLMNGHFAIDGLVLVAPRADAWFATSHAAHMLDSGALERAIGRPLRDLLPAGRDRARWRRWLTESQMLLHEHALARREGATVDSLWFHGGGRLPAAATIPDVTLRAGGGRSGDIVRGIARLRSESAGEATSLDDARPGERDLLVALATVDTLGALADASQRFIGPALERLQRGAVSAVKLIASGGARAASWNARNVSWLARWKRRSSRFAPIPAPIDE